MESASLKVTFTLPYDPRISKNNMKGLMGPGVWKRIGLTPDYRNAMAEHLIVANMALRQHEWARKKTWVRVMMYRPHWKSDPVNFTDAICDIVKRAIMVDDRHFAYCVDWVRDEKNPRFEIEVSQ